MTPIIPAGRGGNSQDVGRGSIAAPVYRRIRRENVRRAFEQAIVTGDDALLDRVKAYLVGQGWIGVAPGLTIEEAIRAVESD